MNLNHTKRGSLKYSCQTENSDVSAFKPDLVIVKSITQLYDIHNLCLNLTVLQQFDSSAAGINENTCFVVDTLYLNKNVVN